jgi:hypothetical protein
VPLALERWAPRDASWFNRPHIGRLPSRWHLVGDDEAPACGYPTLLSIDLHNGWDQQPPRESMKCSRCLAWLKRHNTKGEHHAK